MAASPHNPEQPDFDEDLRRAAEGDTEARKRLWANHYDLLHQCAKAWLKKHWSRGDDAQVSLDGTDVVNAAFERLFDRTAAMAHGKPFFFRAFYTECMRIVVDHYRKTRNDKGRGAMKRIELPSQFEHPERPPANFDAIYDALAELEASDPRTGQVAMLKVLESRPVEGKSGGNRGLTNGEVAELLGVSLRTVEDDWRFAKALLAQKLGGDQFR